MSVAEEEAITEASSTSTMMVLESLPYLDNVRQNVATVREGNLDVAVVMDGEGASDSNNGAEDPNTSEVGNDGLLEQQQAQEAPAPAQQPLEDKEQRLSFCHIVAMNRYTIEQFVNETTNQEIIDRTYYLSSKRTMGAVALALQHLNTGNGVVVPEIEGLSDRCNIRFTAEFLDTAGTESYAVDQLVDVLNREQPTTTGGAATAGGANSSISTISSPAVGGGLQQPQPEQQQSLLPCAFVGARKSAVSIPMALLTSMKDYVQMSPLSLSDQLDNKELFPLFGRVRPGIPSWAEPLVDFLIDELHLTHVAVVHTDDTFGISFLDALRDAIAKRAAEAEDGTVISIETVGYPDRTQDFQSTIQALKDTQYRFFVGAIHGYHYAPIMVEAYKQGIAGDVGGGTHNWLFASLISPLLEPDIESVKVQYRYSDDTYEAVRNASRGVLEYVSVGGLPGIGRYNELIDAWEQIGNNPLDLQYLQSKVPLYPPHEPPFGLNFTADTFDASLETDPGRFALFYDTIIALGLGACNAQQQQQSDTDASILDGQHHYQSTINTTFTGASGSVHFDQITGSRKASSALFTITNFPLAGTEEDPLALGIVKTNYYDKGWRKVANIQFSDGSTTIPQALPPEQVNMNYVGFPLHVAGLALAGVVLFFAIGCSLWTRRYRLNRVVKASQPMFLQLVCAGVVFLGAAIIPLSFDDDIVSAGAAQAACISYPWLVAVGWCTAFSALFVKTRRVVLIFHNPRKFKKVTVKPRDVIFPMIGLLGLNVLLLIIWTVLSRNDQIWSRVPTEERDYFGRPIASTGRCDFSQHGAFLITLVTLDLGFLVFLVQQAWVARKISIQYSESEWIAKALGAIFITAFVGLPVLVMAYDNLQVFYFVQVAIIFITSVSLLGFIFFPKDYYRRHVVASRRVLISGLGHGQALRNSETSPPSYGSSHVTESGGALVTDHPQMKQQLEEEITNLQDTIEEKDAEILRLMAVIECKGETDENFNRAERAEFFTKSTRSLRNLAGFGRIPENRKEKSVECIVEPAERMESFESKEDLEEEEEEEEAQEAQEEAAKDLDVDV